MNKKLNICVQFCALTAILLFSATATCAAGSKASLDTCFKAALKQSETVALQQELINQAEQHLRQAIAAIMPGISGNLSYFTQDISFLPQGTSASSSNGTLPNQTTGKISATAPLFHGFRDLAALSQTQNLLAAQKQNYQASALQLYSDTSQAFYLVLYLENDVRILQKESELYQKRIKELQARIAIGRSRATEVLTVQTSLAALLGQTEQIKSQLSTARELLSFLTGLPASIELEDAKEAPAAADALETYTSRLDNRPDIKAAQADLEAANNSVSIANGAVLPSLDLGANYYLLRPQGTLQNSRWDAQLVLSQPLFTGGYNLSKMAESRFVLNQSKITLQLVKRSAEKDIRALFQQLQYDISQMVEFKNAVSLSEKNYKAVLSDYDLGLGTNLDVLAALTLNQDMSRNLNKAQFAAKTDLSRMLAITAQIKIPEYNGK